MKKPPLYRKLASAHVFGVTKGGWLSLHLAPDHLLLRSSSGFVETYRRFYLADIEAITVCETVRGLFWNAGFGFGIFVPVAIMLARHAPNLVAGIWAGFFALLLVGNMMRGTTCRALLQTRVQTAALPLRRKRTALRLLVQLSDAIRAAQSHIVDAPSTPMQLMPKTSPFSPNAHATTPPPLTGEPLPDQTTPLQLCALGLLPISGSVALIENWLHQPLLAYLLYAMTVGNLGLAIAVLVEKRRRHLRSRITSAMWTSVVAHAVALPIVYMVFNIVHIAQVVRVRGAKGQMPQTQLGLDALRDLPGFNYVLLSYGIFALLLAIFAFVLLSMRRSRRVQPSNT